VLEKRGLGNRPFADFEERRTGLRTIGAHDLPQAMRPHRIAERMQYALNTNIVY
jgi:hypothetical protein